MISARNSRFLKAAVFSLAAQVLSSPCGAQARGTFVPTGGMIDARSQHTATLMTDGRVLLTGGSSAAGGTVLNSTEIFDPSNGKFTPGAFMREGRRMHSATLLADGRVLIAGGFNRLGAVASAELYDPVTNTFAPAGLMITGRGWHDAILLANGTVLIVGGNAGAWPEIPAAEIYNPATGAFWQAGEYVGSGACDFCPPSVRLADGRVLFPWRNPAQLYDPATGGFEKTGQLVTAPSTAALLKDGRVLFTGGEDYGRSELAEVFDPLSGMSRRTADMSIRRVWHSLTLLPDGTVLTAGGETDSCVQGFCMFAGTVATAELYEPFTGRFMPIGSSMITPRETHTATLLNDGSVLIAGGVGYGGIGVFYGGFASAELYVPARPIAAPVLVSLAQDQSDWSVLEVHCIGLDEASAVPPDVTIGGQLAKVLSISTDSSAGERVLRAALPAGVALDVPSVVQLRYFGQTSNVRTVIVKPNPWRRFPVMPFVRP